jgi:hypothetical protein
MTQPVRRFAGLILAVTFVSGLANATQVAAQTPTGLSTAKVKELSAIMKGKNIDSFVAKEGQSPNRFVAVMLVADVQLLLVSAVYSRPTDIEYRIYQKDYAQAYRDLRAGALASERFFIEDVLADGLMATPAKNAQPDSVTVGTATQSFVGAADPKKSKDTRMPLEPYMKAFSEADKHYAEHLDGLIQELKKAGVVAPARELR